MSRGDPPPQTEEAAVIAAVRAGEEAAFTALAERYRRQLHVHCYRMLGSFDDAEDLVQETFLCAWRGRRSCQLVQQDDHGPAAARALIRDDPRQHRNLSHPFTPDGDHPSCLFPLAA